MKKINKTEQISMVALLAVGTVVALLSTGKIIDHSLKGSENESNTEYTLNTLETIHRYALPGLFLLINSVRFFNGRELLTNLRLTCKSAPLKWLASTSFAAFKQEELGQALALSASYQMIHSDESPQWMSFSGIMFFINILLSYLQDSDNIYSLSLLLIAGLSLLCGTSHTLIQSAHQAEGTLETDGSSAYRLEYTLFKEHASEEDTKEEQTDDVHTVLRITNSPK